MSSIKFKKLTRNAVIPRRGTVGSAGFDLYATEDRKIIGGGGCIVVPTGIALQLPEGPYYARIAMRSGLAVNEHLATSAGCIDIDYTGSIGVVVFCTKNNHEYTIKAGDRFAQLIPEMVTYAAGEEVTGEFEPRFNTQHDGWGSTGKK